MSDVQRKRFVVPAALLAALVLSGFIGWMVESRAAILRDGTEVLLKTEPIDPRDLLRGRYVRLGYEISRIEGAVLEQLKSELDEDVSYRNHTLFVMLSEGEGGFYTASGASFDKPGEGVFLKGKVRRLDGNSNSITVDYGIDRFYTDEQRAPELERNMREGQLTEIVVAVSPKGEAQIKALRQNGETIVTEPPY